MSENGKTQNPEELVEPTADELSALEISNSPIDSVQDSCTEKSVAEMVQKRADELLPAKDEEILLDGEFVKECLDSNERGDGVLFSTIFKDKFLLNVTSKEPDWYRWSEHVWEKDDFNTPVKHVDFCAIEYLKVAADLQAAIELEGIDDKKKHEKGWMISLKESYEKRATRLRGRDGAIKTLFWAPIVDDTMACKESDFDQKPWLLPVRNGVIDLKKGVLIPGKQEDLLTRRVDIDYDPHADYTPWLEYLSAVSYDEFLPGSEEIAPFLKRLFGYAITGKSNEQNISVFVGPGRNGKGVLFNMIGEIMGPYYHEVNQGMLIEQRNEPSPNAASEHKYSLLGKRIIVGAETNKGKKIDGQAIKSLTGEDKVNCRPNFGKEINFDPTHTLFVHTNHLPHGLTSDFALLERLLLIEFPYRYVDDPEAKAKSSPGQAHRFRKKDPNLKKKLKKCLPGVLRWLVEGCLEWQKEGLNPPKCILEKVNELAKESDYLGQFLEDCITNRPDNKDLKIPCAAIDDALKWWWSVNMDKGDRLRPHIKTVNKQMRDRGYKIEKVGGKTHVFSVSINYDVVGEIDDFIRENRFKS